MTTTVNEGYKKTRGLKIQRFFASFLTVFSLMATGISTISGSITLTTLFGGILFIVGAVWQISLYRTLKRIARS